MVPKVEQMLRQDDADDVIKDEDGEEDELMKKLKKVRTSMTQLVKRAPG